MKSRPILFSGEMVRAILDGRKTQTRRVCKEQPRHVFTLGRINSRGATDKMHFDEQDTPVFDVCPYGQPGDRLWVRETFAAIEGPHISTVVYRADSGMPGNPAPCDLVPGMPAKWTPSIFMRQRFSRITLEIVRVRVERLQDISEADADAECFGGDFPGRVLPDLFPGDPEQWCHLTMRECYARLWNFINGPGSWDANPWVWVVEFKRVTP